MLSEYGLTNLYDVLKREGISAENIWHVGEDNLGKWGVPTNDILSYTRMKKDYEGKFHLFRSKVRDYNIRNEWYVLEIMYIF